MLRRMGAAAVFFAAMLPAPGQSASPVDLGAATRCLPAHNTFELLSTAHTLGSRGEVLAPDDADEVSHSEHRAITCKLGDVDVRLTVTLQEPHPNGEGSLTIEALEVDGFLVLKNRRNFNWQVGNERVLTRFTVRVGTARSLELCASNGWRADAPYANEVCETRALPVRHDEKCAGDAVQTVACVNELRRRIGGAIRSRWPEYRYSVLVRDSRDDKMCGALARRFEAHAFDSYPSCSFFGAASSGSPRVRPVTRSEALALIAPINAYLAKPHSPLQRYISGGQFGWSDDLLSREIADQTRRVETLSPTELDGSEAFAYVLEADPAPGTLDNPRRFLTWRQPNTRCGDPDETMGRGAHPLFVFVLRKNGSVDFEESDRLMSLPGPAYSGRNIVSYAAIEHEGQSLIVRFEWTDYRTLPRDIVAERSWDDMTVLRPSAEGLQSVCSLSAIRR